MIKKIFTSILFLSALMTLVSLGFWQLQRLEWKTDIIERLEVEYAKDQNENQFIFDDLIALGSDLPLRYGSVQGRFNYKNEILVGPKPYDGSIGFLVITPMKLKNNGNILVNRGWIAENKIKDLGKTHLKGLITIAGIVRQPDWNRFTPNNSPENNIWTKLDIQQIATTKNIQQVAPVILYAENASKDFSPIIMQANKWQPRNKHKQYALFWFTMALTLIGVFGLYLQQNRKEKSAR